MPDSSSPHCYNTWDEAPAGRKSSRWVKRQVSQLMRRRGLAIIRSEIRDIDNLEYLITPEE